MRFSQVLVVVAASFLFTTEALSATTDSNQAKIGKVASPGGPSHRLLRAHYSVEEEEEEDLDEERGGGISNFSQKHQDKLIAYAAKLGFDANKAANDVRYFATIDAKNLEKYRTLYNKIYKKYH